MAGLRFKFLKRLRLTGGEANQQLNPHPAKKFFAVTFLTPA